MRARLSVNEVGKQVAENAQHAQRYEGGFTRGRDGVLR